MRATASTADDALRIDRAQHVPARAPRPQPHKPGHRHGDGHNDAARCVGYAAPRWADKPNRKHAKDAVTDEMIEALTIAGDPLYCRRELRRRYEYGLEYPLITLPPGLSWPQLAAFITVLAPTPWG